MFLVAGRFGRVEPRRTAREFVLGLLSPLERKNCWWLAEQAGHHDPQAMQRLLRTAVWDADAVRDDVRGFVAAQFGDAAGVLIPDETGPAGSFNLSVPFVGAGSAHPAPEHVALVLHTSGTTSRPKIVPLRHSNLAASAKHISATLALTPSDRSLVIMPLFHIHGLIGALSSSLYAGASVFCPPKYFSRSFLASFQSLAVT